MHPPKRPRERSSRAIPSDKGFKVRRDVPFGRVYIRKRTVTLDVIGEIDTWSGNRYEAWESEEGFKARKSKVFTAIELKPELGKERSVSKEDFERMWAKLIETSKDKWSVGVPNYTQREIYKMSLDPTIWTLEAKDSGEDVLTFTVTGGPRTPIQEELCDLLKGLM
jgi:hypothetical protein